MKEEMEKIKKDLMDRWNELEPATKITVIFAGILAFPFGVGTICCSSMLLRWLGF